MTYARQLWETLRSFVLGPTKLSDLQRWFEGNTGTGTTSVTVTEDSAQTLSAVWNAVNLIAGTVGSLPLQLYRRTADGDREVMSDHWLYPVLHDRPNPDMSAMDFRQTLQSHVLNWGNAFAEITRDGAGRVKSLYPIHPTRVTLKRDGGGLYYEVSNSEDQTVIKLAPSNMLHIKGYSPDGLWGYSVIAKARESMGYTLRSEQFGSAFFGNATIHGGIVKHPGRLSEQAHTRLLHDLEARHKGAANWHKLAVLEEGMTWERMGIPPVDAQFLECVVPGTLITMANGTRRPVETIRPGESVLAWNGVEFTSAKVAARGLPRIKPLVRIRTARGRELVASADHPVLTIRRLRTAGGRPEIPDPKWVPMNQLQVGQYVRIALGAITEGTGTLSFDEAYFLGAMVGDGYIRRGGCSFSGIDPGVLERVRIIARSLGGDLKQRGADANWQLNTGGVGRRASRIRRLLNRSGLVGTHSHTKFVPWTVVTSGPIAWRGFLSGYCDTDGSIRDPDGRQKPAAYWHSTSRGLLEECQHLLASLGIQSTLYVNAPAGRRIIMGMSCETQPAWTLYVMGRGPLSRLATALDPAHSVKRERLARYARVSPSRYRAINFNYDCLVSVELLGDGDTLGLEIADHHTHVTNGILTHNSRTFQILEICRWYNIQPHKLKELTHATFTNIEHQSQEFVQDTLMPWLVKWEQEMNFKLIMPAERKIQYVQHNLDGLLRADTESRYRAYATAKTNGWLNANTICQKENLPRLPDEEGEIYLVMSNMIPVARAGLGVAPEVGDPGVTEAPPKLPAPPEPEESDEEEDEAGRAALIPAPSNGHPDPRRKAQLVTAQRALIADVVRRALAREMDKARTAAQRAERLRAWIGEFYPRHTESFRGQLLPVVQMHLALTASTAEPDTLTRQLAEAHVAESKRQLYLLLEQKLEDLHGAVDDLMRRWDLERIHVIPDALLVEEITYGL